MRCLLVLVLGCGSAASPAPTVAPAARVTPELPAARVFLVDAVDGEAQVQGEVATVTLLGLGSRCVGPVVDGWVEGCPAPTSPRIAIEGDVIATLVGTKRGDTPSLDVDAPLVGRFDGHAAGFLLDSPPSPDGLCPGAPTRVQLFADHRDATPSGETTLPASVAREIGEGVLGMIVLPDRALVLLGWGRDQRRVVSLDGEVQAEGHVVPALPDCDCCE